MPEQPDEWTFQSHPLRNIDLGQENGTYRGQGKAVGGTPTALLFLSRNGRGGQCGGNGARDVDGAVGARTGAGLRAGAAMGSGGGGSGILIRISATAPCSLSITRPIWS